jgi:hypothetical protein
MRWRPLTYDSGFGTNKKMLILKSFQPSEGLLAEFKNSHEDKNKCRILMP